MPRCWIYGYELATILDLQKYTGWKEDRQEGVLAHDEQGKLKVLPSAASSGKLSEEGIQEGFLEEVLT